MTFSLQTHVKGRLDKGYYKVFLLSCSSGFHTQRLMDELGPYLMNAGHDTTFIELQIHNHMVPRYLSSVYLCWNGTAIE